MTTPPLPQPTIHWPYAYFSCPTHVCAWTHAQNIDPGPFKILVPHNPTSEDIDNAITTHNDASTNRWVQQTHQALNDHLTEQHNTTLAALTPPPPEPAPPLPKGLLDLLDKNPPNLDELVQRLGGSCGAP